MFKPAKLKPVKHKAFQLTKELYDKILDKGASKTSYSPILDNRIYKECKIDNIEFTVDMAWNGNYEKEVEIIIRPYIHAILKVGYWLVIDSNNKSKVYSDEEFKNKFKLGNNP